jgi:AcrR family transcriptional regulator
MTEELDRRVRRTRQRLTEALVSLCREKPYGEITMKDLLARADVGRATFYAHYRDKEDLLISLFLGMIDHFEAIGLERNPGAVLPAAPYLLAHFAEAREFARALARAGKMEVLLRACEARLRRNLEARLPPRADPPPAITAAVAAGAFTTVVSAWMNAGSQTPPDVLAGQLERLLAPGVKAATA